MRRRTLQLSFCAITLLLVIAPLAYGRGNEANTAPGKYKSWGPDIDEIEILSSFKISNYDKVVVLPFDTSATPLPDPKEKSYDTIKKVLGSFAETFTEAFRTELKSKATVETAATAPKDARTLLVRGKVVSLSPGSRAGRMLVGYGAGGSGAKVSAEIVDAKSGDVLLRYTQERRSGGSFKFAGGNDMQVMRDAIHAEAQDAAHILDLFK